MKIKFRTWKSRWSGSLEVGSEYLIKSPDAQFIGRLMGESLDGKLVKILILGVQMHQKPFKIGEKIELMKEECKFRKLKTVPATDNVLGNYIY